MDSEKKNTKAATRQRGDAEAPATHYNSARRLCDDAQEEGQLADNGRRLFSSGTEVLDTARNEEAAGLPLPSFLSERAARAVLRQMRVRLPHMNSETRFLILPFSPPVAQFSKHSFKLEIRMFCVCALFPFSFFFLRGEEGGEGVIDRSESFLCQRLPTGETCFKT